MENGYQRALFFCLQQCLNLNRRMIFEAALNGKVDLKSGECGVGICFLGPRPRCHDGVSGHGFSRKASSFSLAANQESALKVEFSCRSIIPELMTCHVKNIYPRNSKTRMRNGGGNQLVIFSAGGCVCVRAKLQGCHQMLVEKKCHF